MRDLQTLLGMASEQHGHLCAGQVLGVRMALRGLSELSIDPDCQPKRLIVFVEINRCAADAIATATGCSLGKRTLKYVDYGKVAAPALFSGVKYLREDWSQPPPKFKLLKY